MTTSSTAPFVFNDNKVIQETVKNERLKTELTYHIVHPVINVDMNKKAVQGQLHSYKSDKLIDAIGESQTPQPSSAIQFTINVTDFTDLDKQVIDYVKKNIQTIASV